ncbi:MAG: S8 family serine peptidase [archaeon]
MRGKIIILIIVIFLLVSTLGVFQDKLFYSKSDKITIFVIAEEIPENIDEGQIFIDIEVVDQIEEKDVQVIIETDSPEDLNIELDEISEDFYSATINEQELKDILQEDITSIREDEVLNIQLATTLPQIETDTVHALQLYNINLTGLGQTVCVIDTGINSTHESLQGRIVAEYCYCDVTDLGSGGCCSDNTNELNNAEDDQGHGTHVAGIVGANGTSALGMAPEVNFIAMKVTNSSGSALISDITEGIQWCSDNAATYNISVITISLGGGAFSSYCDSAYPTMAAAIQDAIDQNVVITIATGNSGTTTTIGTPACIENATAIGSVDKGADTIPSYVERNSLTDLLAPGGTAGNTVTSLNYLGGTTGKYGTSMAAPHAAGAIILMNQYLNLSGQTKTTQQIESTLNKTGLAIDDSANSGRIFPRIDIYKAIAALDIDQPNVTLTSPANNTNDGSANQTFSCNVSDFYVSNITLKIWNSTYLFNNQTNTTTGTTNSSDFDVTGLTTGTYYWNCLAKDYNNNEAYATENFTLIIAQAMQTTLTSPADNSITNTNPTSFACSSIANETAELANVTFSIWNSTSLVYNETTDKQGATNSSSFSYIIPTDGTYSWNCLSTNNKTQSVYASANYTRIYDTIKPAITLTSPADKQIYSSSLQEITFQYGVTDTNSIDNCSLIIDSTINATDASATGSFTKSYPIENYTWYTNCTDSANNQNMSEQRTFNISTPTPVSPNSGSPGGSGGGSSGGGGGGSGTSTSVTQIIESASAENPISFSINNLLIPITHVDIDVNKELANIKVKVEALEETIVLSPKGILYQYLEITTTNFDNEDISNGELEFKVLKTWIRDNDVTKEDIVLQRYTTSWEELSTRYIRVENDSYVYAATTPGFSYFAITAITEESVIEETPSEYPPEEDMIVEILEEEEREPGFFKEKTKLISIVSLSLILALLIVLLVWRLLNKNAEYRRTGSNRRGNVQGKK